MANVMKVKTRTEMAIGNKLAYLYAIELVDGTSGAVVPATLKQTDECTAIFVGVAPYGAVIFTTENTATTDVLKLTAHPLHDSGTSNDVSVSISASGLIALDVGDTVVTDQL